MDFIVKDVHTEHDDSWLLYSTVHDCPVCLGCIVETIENSELLPLQRKPALTEFQRLLQHQESDVLQLFMQEENIVWHLLTVLLESLSLKDEGYVAMCIEVLLKIIQVVGSDDLVTTVLDKISSQSGALFSINFVLITCLALDLIFKNLLPASQLVSNVLGNKKVKSTTDHLKLLPHYTLLGKLIFQLPALVHTLQTQYDLLLYELSTDLCNGGEVIQSAVAYIFIFLCDVNQINRLSTRIMQQLHSGIIIMLSSAQSLPVQINGLGLLKKLLLNDECCQILMSLNNQQMTLLSSLKKLLLGKKDIIQTGVSQILWLILKKENYNVYATEILHSDIVEFLFESLHTENTEQIECIFKVLRRLSDIEQFYKRCHSVYGVESILRALTSSIEMKHPSLLKSGYSLLTDILNRHPDDVPLFLNGTVVKKCLCVIQHGLEHHQTAIFTAAQDTFTAMLRRKYLLSPVPFLQLRDMFSILLQKKTDHIKVFVHNEKKQHSNGPNFFMSVEIFLDQIIKCCQLIMECKDDLTACENNFCAPGSQTSTPSYDSFISILVDSFSLICSLMTMKFWDHIKREQYYIKFLEAMCSVNNISINVVSGFCYKLVSAGVLNGLVDAKVKYSSAQLSSLTGRLLQFVSEISFTESFLPSEFMVTEVNVDCFQWCLAVIPKVFIDQKIDIKTVESYLWIIFLSYKFDHCIYSEEEMSTILSAITNQHTLMELSSIARKHIIFLLAYLGTQGNVDVRQVIPNVLQSLPTVLQDTDTIWYTHDTTLLEWIFSDPVLAGTCGQIVIEIFMTNSSVDSIQELYGSGRYNKTDVINQLGHSKTFVSSMIKNMATCNGESVPKYSIILENYILHMKDNNHDHNEEETMFMQEMMSDNFNFVESYHLPWMLDQVTTVLQDVFLKNYPQSNGYNISGLLQLLVLALENSTEPCSIDVKVLYHVMNKINKNDEEEDESDLFKSCMLTVLAAITCNNDNQNSVCGMVLQHKGFMEVLQKCMDQQYGCTMFNISCDILTILVGTKNAKTCRSINIDTSMLVDIIIHRNQDIMVAGIKLLTAIFYTDLTSCIVNLSHRIYPNTFRTLYIHLQQICMQDVTEYASCAVQCMKELIYHLYRSDTEQYLGDELLSQPWNKALIEISLDLALCGSLYNHHLYLFSFFLGTEHGCIMMKTIPQITDKLLQLVRMDVFNEDREMMESCNEMIRLMLQKLEDSLSAEDIQWLKEKVC